MIHLNLVSHLSTGRYAILVRIALKAPPGHPHKIHKVAYSDLHLLLLRTSYSEDNRGRQRLMISSDLRVRRSLISFISYTRDRIRDIRTDDASDIHIVLPHQTYSGSYHLYCCSDVTKVDVRI